MESAEDFFERIYNEAKKDLKDVEKFYSKMIRDFDVSSFDKELVYVDFLKYVQGSGMNINGLIRGYLVTAIHIPYDTQRVKIVIYTEFRPYTIKFFWTASNDKSLERILEESKSLPKNHNVDNFIRIVPCDPFIYIGDQSITIYLEGFSGKYEYYLELCKYPGKLIEHTFPFNGDPKYFNKKYLKQKHSVPSCIRESNRRLRHTVAVLDGEC